MASGDQTIERYVLTDMKNVCRGKQPCDMKVLDFGCGAGRVTRPLGKLFGEVHGGDIGSEMLKQAATRACSGQYEKLNSGSGETAANQRQTRKSSTKESESRRLRHCAGCAGCAGPDIVHANYVEIDVDRDA